MVRSQFTLEQRHFLYKRYMKLNDVYTFEDLFLDFQQKFPTSRIPSRQSVRDIAKKFDQSFTLENQNKGHSGRKRTVRTTEAVQEVQRQLQAERDLASGDHRSSCRRNQLDLSRATFHRIVKHDMNWMAYKLGKACEISERTKQMRLTMCQYLVSQPQCYFRRLLITDEAIFQLNGHVLNRGTNFCYSEARQGRPRHFVTQSIQNPQKIMVFAVMCGLDGKIFPYFFPPGTRLSSREYIATLDNTVLPDLKAHYGPINYSTLIYQQDGAACHRSQEALRYLDREFQDRMLALGSHQGVDWSPSSPDLSPLDFYLWAELKKNVYKTPLPTNLDELANKILVAIENIMPQEVMKAILAMKKRAAKCIDAGRDYFE